MSSGKVRVRFAPSPTGPLHIGSVRTALYNYLFARKHGGDFLLRIEDTDRNRYVPEAETYIHESLKWCGLSIGEGPEAGGDFGPYRQSERREIYQQYATELLASGAAYHAFDLPEDLKAARDKAKESGNHAWQYDAATRGYMKNSLSLSEEEVRKLLDADYPYTIRLKMPKTQEIQFEDMIRGTVSVNSETLDDKIIFKADGMPTYHLANVVDDHLMKITHVIRGEEWLPSTPLHVVLYKSLGWENEMPKFAHLPLILRPDGNGKLSKRDGDRLGFPVFPLNWKDPESGELSIGYREQGYYPEAVLNILAFLGWNPGTEQELFSLEELINEFSLDRVGKGGAKFDVDKAQWYNQQYLWKKSDEELAQGVKADGYDVQVTDDYLSKAFGLMKERISFADEIFTDGAYLFQAPKDYDEKLVRKKWKNNTAGVIKELKAIFSECSCFDSATLEEVFKQHIEKNELGFGAILNCMRLVITGVGGGPSLFDIMELIGKEESIKRIETGLVNINQLKEVQ